MVCPDREMPTQQVMPKLSREPNYYVDDVVPLANKSWGQPVRKGQDQEEEEMGPRVAEIWVSTGEAGNLSPSNNT
jgi:hypothetical protein